MIKYYKTANSVWAFDTDNLVYRKMGCNFPWMPYKVLQFGNIGEGLYVYDTTDCAPLFVTTPVTAIFGSPTL